MTRVIVFAIGLGCWSTVAFADEAGETSSLLASGDRVVFIGDSNTYAGRFISEIEAQWLKQFPGQSVEFINAGLPSETACGLSEPIHPFPRPSVQERIDRVLDKMQPDVLVIGYGMNDGIYHPFDKTRFAAYRKGIRTLVRKAKKQGAKVVLLTPPPFDPLPLKKRGKLRPQEAEEFSWMTIYEDYDEVMDRYATWTLKQRATVDAVVDIRSPFVEYLARRRKSDSSYMMSDDGVHFNGDGHAIIAQAILDRWGIPLVDVSRKFQDQVHQAQMIVRDSAVSHIGHKRPGIKPGLDWNSAVEKSKQLKQQFNPSPKSGGL
ncbi:MAG: SGNH/GDSL hydrolase family protein [Pirellulaceae bacterium]|nr:SGNH/GDSL hydrolase family protein [Pirellulaceae bacterium]